MREAQQTPRKNFDIVTPVFSNGMKMNALKLLTVKPSYPEDDYSAGFGVAALYGRSWNGLWRVQINAF
jgi:hypothetical protein